MGAFIFKAILFPAIILWMCNIRRTRKNNQQDRFYKTNKIERRFIIMFINSGFFTFKDYGSFFISEKFTCW